MYGYISAGVGGYTSEFRTFVFCVYRTGCVVGDMLTGVAEYVGVKIEDQLRATQIQRERLMAGLAPLKQFHRGVDGVALLAPCEGYEGVGTQEPDF